MARDWCSRCGARYDGVTPHGPGSCREPGDPMIRLTALEIGAEIAVGRMLAAEDALRAARPFIDIYAYDHGDPVAKAVLVRINAILSTAQLPTKETA